MMMKMMTVKESITPDETKVKGGKDGEIHIPSHGSNPKLIIQKKKESKNDMGRLLIRVMHAVRTIMCSLAILSNIQLSIIS